MASVWENDLAGAIALADTDSLAALRPLVVLLHNEAPPQCWRSPARVACWEMMWAEDRAEIVANCDSWRRFMEVGKGAAVGRAMIDAQHGGGIDGFVKAAAVCDAAYRPVVTHLSPEIAVHLGASIPNCNLVEYMDWSFGLFEETIGINADGRMIVPQTPGFGVTLDQELAKRGIKD